MKHERNNVDERYARRAAVYEDMNSAAQEVAQDFRAVESKLARANVLVKYDLGASITDYLTKHPEADEAATLRQLGRFTPYTPADLRELVAVVRHFTRPDAEQLALREMSNGRHVNYRHLVAMTAVASPEARAYYWERVFTECWTDRDLAKAIHGAARRNTRRCSSGEPERKG